MIREPEQIISNPDVIHYHEPVNSTCPFSFPPCLLGLMATLLRQSSPPLSCKHFFHPPLSLAIPYPQPSSLSVYISPTHRS